MWRDLEQRLVILQIQAATRLALPARKKCRCDWSGYGFAALCGGLIAIVAFGTGH